MSNFYHYIGAAPLAPSPYYVLLATPATSHPECNHEKSMVATAETLARSGIQFDYQLVQGSCHVDDVRNGIIRNFLQWQRPKSDVAHCRYSYTDLFFLDADMGWDAQSIVDLLQAPGDIVGGVYRHKSDLETYPFQAGQFAGLGLNDAQLFEMPKIATGFMRIRRPVLEKLYEIEAERKRISWSSPVERAKNAYPVARIVERGWPRALDIPEEIEPGNDYQSGDYVLCLKARKAGFRVFVDPDMKFSHAGDKVWVGHFGNHLRHEQGKLPASFGEAIEALKTGKADADVFGKLFAGWDILTGQVRSPLNGNPCALEAGALQELYTRAREAKAPVLEMGSGLSTLVLGIALQGTGQVVHVLEDQLDSFRRTGGALEQHKIKNVVLHYVPLMPVGEREQDVAYSVADEDLPAAFGLVLVDGPHFTAYRTSALWAQRSRIRGATLLVDDIDTSATLVEMLEKAGHTLDVQGGGAKRWAIATPGARAVPAEPKVSPLRPLVVSLTSHPPRYKHLHHALASLLNQDMAADHVVLWLARSEFAALPSSILRMDGLTVRQCDDIRQYKKLIPAMEHYPDAFVVTADDDLVYPRSWLREMVEAYGGKKEILLRRARRFGTEPGDMVASGYNTWPLVMQSEAGAQLFPTSCHGMLVPPGAMSPEVMDMAKAMNLCPTNDDIWWYWMGLRGGSTFRVVAGSEQIYDLPSGKDGLWSQVNRDGGNDTQIAGMIEAYGLPWAPAVKEAAE